MKSVLFLLAFISGSILMAQQVTGVILDDNSEPLSQATVYYDGSTVGTLSKKDGSFSIDYNPQLNLTLVIRFLGYKTYYLDNPKPGEDYKITLKPEENRLDEVVLDASLFSREEMLEAFKRDFLGKTKAGRKAIIQNEEVIKFFYDKNEKSLYASSRQPIQILNKELGYKVEFDLVDFVSEFSKVTLDADYQKTNYFGGTSFFQNSAEETRRVQRKRLKAYYGSSMHFFKSLCDGDLKRKQYQLFHKSNLVNASDFFEVKKVKRKVRIPGSLEVQTYEDSYLVTLVGNDLDVLNKNNSSTGNKFQKSIALLYKGDRSDIIFKTKEFYVDSFGNHTNINEILFNGEMSKGRIGGMLPVNYQPND